MRWLHEWLYGDRKLNSFVLDEDRPLMRPRRGWGLKGLGINYAQLRQRYAEKRTIQHYIRNM